MILTDTAIQAAMEAGDIVIQPYTEKQLGPNSYDVCLGPNLATYDNAELDAKKHNTITTFPIPKEGYLLMPGELYLGTTLEHTETYAHIPMLEGKSSTGRLGIDIHATAGVGDIGFKGTWTLEISVTRPVRIYKNMPIGQLIYHTPKGTPSQLYHQKKTSKYWNANEHTPRESMMWKNDF